MNVTNLIRKFLTDNLDNENIHFTVDDEKAYLRCTPEGEVQIETYVTERTFELDAMTILCEVNENEYHFVYLGKQHRLYMSKSPYRKDYIVRYHKPGCCENTAYVFMQVDTRGNWKNTICEMMEERVPGAKILCVGEVVNFFTE